MNTMCNPGSGTSLSLSLVIIQQAFWWVGMIVAICGARLASSCLTTNPEVSCILPSWVTDKKVSCAFHSFKSETTRKSAVFLLHQIENPVSTNFWLLSSIFKYLFDIVINIFEFKLAVICKKFIYSVLNCPTSEVKHKSVNFGS